MAACFPLRAAPLGAVRPELVAATFYSFDPDMVRGHIPTAWAAATDAGRAGRFAELVLPVTMAAVRTGLLPQRSTLGLGR